MARRNNDEVNGYYALTSFQRWLLFRNGFPATGWCRALRFVRGQRNTKGALMKCSGGRDYQSSDRQRTARSVPVSSSCRSSDLVHGHHSSCLRAAALCERHAQLL